jgi:hypothetical protein
MEDSLASFLERFFKPQFVESFQPQELEIAVFRSPQGDPEFIQIPNFYPFLTFNDLKTAIYNAKRKDPDFYPSFQFLCDPAFDEEFESQQQMYTPSDYTWFAPDGKTEYSLKNPFSRARGNAVDERFVTSTGEKRVIGFSDKKRILLESVTPMRTQFHLYLYKDVLNSMDPALRVSEREWFGRMGPYFPELDPLKRIEALRPKEVENIDSRIRYLTTSIQSFNRLDSLLNNPDVKLLPIGLAGVKFLRFHWKRPDEETPQLETLFYQTNVTKERPFLRILPSDSQAITKVRLAGFLKIPDLSDPRLLLQWAQERNPTPEKDYAFAKLMIRRSLGTQPALYGTLRLFEDKTSDFILMPPKQMKRLEPRSDLSEFMELFSEGLEGMPMASQMPEIGEATLICGIRLPVDRPRITRSILKKRLDAFSSMFQEISPLPGEQPLAMLRYKLVNNFATEDRMFAFLTQLTSHRLLQGEGSEYVTTLSQQFQLDQEEATKQVATWLRLSGQSETVIPETKDHIMTYNKGIDIGIFAQHPFYSFHLYRVDSLISLERIITALSLLFSADETFLRTSQAFANAAAAATAATATSIGFAQTETPQEEVEESGVDETDFMFDEGLAFEDTEDTLDVEEQPSLADRVRANSQPPQREVEAALPAPVAAAPILQKEAPEESDEEEEQTKTKRFDKYLVRKLQDADRRLFEYKGPKGVKLRKYVTMCQATETRQPAVLSQEQYERMREEYANDPVIFLVYPLEQDEAEPDEGEEVYTILKYGSDPLHQNYYLCCEYFCTNDYILVREHDLKKEVDRKGKAKPKNSCPFCHGLIIKNLKDPGHNETIIHRKVKPKSKDDKRHLYVRFLKDTFHPEGFYQPCCFIDTKTIHISDKQFEHIRAASQLQPSREDGDAEEEPVSAGTVPLVPMMDYQVTLYKAHKKYIVGPEKFPLKLGELDGPQIGLLFPKLDAYFGQNPADFVSREFNRMELKPESKAFLRIGVENRSQFLPDSFLASIAPALFLNTAEQVKQKLLSIITPRIFLFLNYGNLVLEFYKPSDPVPQDSELRIWVFRELEVDLSAENKEAVIRLWKSYHRFQGFITSTTSESLKQYRQFAHLLALPRLITTRGFVCIILDINEKDEVEVRCPPYGYNLEQYAGSDILFLLHHYSGVWEPIFYSMNQRASARFPESHETTLLFQRSLEGAWPPIVKQRVREFTSRCVSTGRAAYTSQSRIDSMSLIPLGMAVQAMEKSPAGIVRDAYNHIAALTFRSKAGKPGLVALPVVDDGTIVKEKKIHLDWDDYERAPMDEALAYYIRDFDPIFSLYPGYRVARRVRSRSTGRYVALQLANGIYIPVKEPKDLSSVETLPLVEVDVMEWSLNREFTYASTQGEREPEEKLLKANENEMNEVFEHLRLTFSNWFSSEEAGPEFRKQIETILFDRKHSILNPPLPLYEKRKRLEILLAPIVLGWMSQSDTEDKQELTSLLRVDCRLRAEASCTGFCRWRQDEGKGQCLLHSPKKAYLGLREVNGPQLLFMRLLEELLRFPERRRQLLQKDVSTLIQTKDAIQVGDQWILPESSVAWFDLLRLDWVSSGKEKKRFFEELSSEVSERPSYQEEVGPSEVLPQGLLQLLGPEDEKTRGVYLYRTQESENLSLIPYLAVLGSSPVELGMPEESSSLSSDAIKRLVRKIGSPVIQLNLTVEPPEVIAYSSLIEQKGGVPYILVITPEGPAILSSSIQRPQAILPDAMPEGLRRIYDERRAIGTTKPQ